VGGICCFCPEFPDSLEMPFQKAAKTGALKNNVTGGSGHEARVVSGNTMAGP
jgi:hypothetical protein